MSDKNFKVKQGLSVAGNVGLGTDVANYTIDATTKTDGIALPSGTTTQRPTTPPNGLFRFNSTLENVEFFSTGLGGWSQFAVFGANTDAAFLNSQPGSYYLNLTNATGTLSSTGFNDSSHGNRAGGNLHITANTTVSGFLSSTDKARLDEIPNGNLVYKYNGEINNTVNLNTLIASGWYKQSLNTQAATGSNYPEPAAGDLYVTSDGITHTQIYVLLSGSQSTWHRRYISSAWTVWRRGWDSVNLTDGVVLSKLLNVDGVGSGLDADLLDGQQGSYYQNAGNLITGTLPGTRFDDGSHGNRSGGTLHALANTSVSGFMASADKVKLDVINYVAADVLSKLLNVDGVGSGLDADLLDGQQGSYYTDVAVNAVGAEAALARNANNLTSGTVPLTTLLNSGAIPYAISIDSTTDLNALTSPGFAPRVYGQTNGNLPVASFFHILVLQYNNTSNIVQIAISYPGAAYEIYIRRRGGAAGWQPWYKVILQSDGDLRYAQLSSPTFTDAINIRTANQGGISLRTSGLATHTGYTEFYNAANVRCGYIGFAAPNGLINYIAENGMTGHNFGGTGSFSGNMTIAGQAAHHDGNSSRGAPDVVMEDQKAAGTAGGTSVAGWATRTINAISRNNGQGTNLTSNIFIFASNGWVEWSTEVLQSGVAKTRLWNVTDNVVVSFGSSVFSAAGAAYCSMTCTGSGPIVAGKQYRLDQYVQTATPIQGLGVASNQGTEVFAQINFWRT